MSDAYITPAEVLEQLHGIALRAAGGIKYEQPSPCGEGCSYIIALIRSLQRCGTGSEIRSLQST